MINVFQPSLGNEELEIILAFEDVLRAADEMFNPREEVSIFEEEVLEVKEEEEEDGEEDEDLDEDYEEEEEEDEEEDALDEALEEEIYELMMEQKNEYQNSHIRFVYADDE